MSSPTIGAKALCFRVVCPSVRPSVCCPSIKNSHDAISISGLISTKIVTSCTLTTRIGNCWKVFQGQMSKVKVIMCTNVWMLHCRRHTLRPSRVNLVQQAGHKRQENSFIWIFRHTTFSIMSFFNSECFKRSAFFWWHFVSLSTRSDVVYDVSEYFK